MVMATQVYAETDPDKISVTDTPIFSKVRCPVPYRPTSITMSGHTIFVLCSKTDGSVFNFNGIIMTLDLNTLYKSYNVQKQKDCQLNPNGCTKF